MTSLYYCAASTDSGCLLGCCHQHATVISAVACIACAGGYVIAVEKNQLRELNAIEEKEFQFATRGGTRPVREFRLLAWPKPVVSDRKLD
jgi:hypothetical protein